MYTIQVSYWSDHNHTHSLNRRANYRDAMNLWRKQCRDHNNAEVILYAPDGHKMKSKGDSWPSEYEIKGGV